MRIISIQVLLKMLAIVVEFRQNMNLSDNDSHYRPSGKQQVILRKANGKVHQ
jgi:hypothetical protein